MSAGPGLVLRRNYLSAIENVAQTIGTMGPTATLGTIVPLLIGKTGNATWLLVAGIWGIFFLIALNITKFAAHTVSAGSLGTYVQMGLGKWPGVFTGWSYVIALTFVVASSGLSSAYYVDLLIVKFTGSPSSLLRSALLTDALVLAAWWPARRDIKLSTKIMLVVELVSVAVILFIVFVAMLHTGHWVDRPQLELAGATPEKFRLGFVLAFMMLAGFESTTTLSEEAKSATTTIPKVMLNCLIPVGLLYLFSTYCLAALSHDHSIALDQTDSPFDAIAASIGVGSLGWISSFGVATSCFVCALGGLNAGSRVLYSMARHGQFLPKFGEAHPVNATPHRAMALITAVSLVVPVTLIYCGVEMANGMDYLMQVASFGFIAAYFLICLGTPVYLARVKALQPVNVMIAVVTLAVIGLVLVLTVYPLPPAPYCYFPYVFAALVLTGCAVSAYCGRLAPVSGADPATPP